MTAVSIPTPPSVVEDVMHDHDHSSLLAFPFCQCCSSSFSTVAARGDSALGQQCGWPTIIQTLVSVAEEVVIYEYDEDDAAT